MEALLVRGFPPWFNVAADKVCRIVNEGDPAFVFNPGDSLLEQALANASTDERLARGGGDVGIQDPALLDVFPFLLAGKLPFNQRSRGILQRRCIKDASVCVGQTKDDLSEALMIRIWFGIIPPR